MRSSLLGLLKHSTRLGGLNNKMYGLSSGGWNSEPSVLAELAASEGWEEEFHATQLLAPCQQFLAFLGLQKLHSDPLPSSPYSALPICVSILITPFYENINYMK